MNYAKILAAGKNIVIPTDTVYGLTCDARSEQAVARVFAVKGRPGGKALPVFVKDVAMAKTVALVDKKTGRFLEKVWPGGVSVVLKVSPDTPLAANVYSSDGTVALRAPKHKVIAEIFKAFSHPIVGTSANISGEPSSGDFRAVMKQWQGRALKPDEVVDYGVLPASEPSTIVAIIKGKLECLRPGAVAFADLVKLWA